MKAFGLVSLLIVLGLGAWLATKPAVAPSATDEADSDTSYGDAINAAKDAAGTMSGGTVEIYDGISVAQNSREVNLSGRGLRGSLKAEMRRLSRLEVLDLSDNNLTDLPAEVGQLSQLRVLNLADNPLTGLPYELGNLQNLETLDLRGTNYATADLEIIKASLPANTQILVD